MGSRKGRRGGGGPGAGQQTDSGGVAPSGKGSLLPALRRAARIRGIAILALIALLGLGLAALGSTGKEASDTVERGTTAVSIEGPQGQRIFLIADRTGTLSGDPEVRCLLSRVPASLDPIQGTVELPSGTVQVVPPSWPTVLVDRDGRLIRHPFRLPLDAAVGLLRSRNFEEARRRVAWFDASLGAWIGGGAPEGPPGSPVPAPGIPHPPGTSESPAR